MKNLLLIFVVLYAFNANSQDTKLLKIIQEPDIEEGFSFKPSRKLLNNVLWTRTSNTRFECKFLRLAVEYHDSEYVLYEMDGQKKELSRAAKYETIGNEISKMTLGSRQHLSKDVSLGIL